MTATSVQVLLFASAREAAGNVSRQLADRYPKLAPLVMDESSLTLAVNEEYVPEGETIVLKTGDTVALIPPISGG
eukprot:scaffold19259_cov54-Attheya_sp.AAC.6